MGPGGSSFFIFFHSHENVSRSQSHLEISYPSMHLAIQIASSESTKMGAVAVAPKFCISPMKSFTGKKSRFGEESSSSCSSIITPTINRFRGNFPWNKFLDIIVSYLDSEICQYVSLVSRSWCRVYDCRGSLTSGDSVSRLVGAEMAYRMSSYWSTERTKFIHRRESSSSKWTDVCDFIMGYFHSYVPQGSQTSTTMALALASEFMRSVPTVSPSSDIFTRQVNQLKSNSYLLSFTAITIAIKIEV
jgi:hypothetical protein